MEIKKYKLANLTGVYSTSTITINGNIYWVGASENPGESCLLFSHDTNGWTYSSMWNDKTGIMNIVQIPGTELLLSITEFYPIFQSKRAGVDLCQQGENLTDLWQLERVINLPYVHRIGIIKTTAGAYLLLSTLCKDKKYQEDWSSSGAIYMCKIPNKGQGSWEPFLIYEGLTKNHGLFILDDTKAFISAQEGVFLFDFLGCKSEEDIMAVLPIKISDVATSEISIGDIDRDGILEIGAIEPFHGDTLTLYKYSSNKLEKIYQDSINFGHVVWIGNINAKPSILCANRGGARELMLYQSSNKDITKGIWEKTIIDSGVGTTQISVQHHKNKTMILASNHGNAEIALYSIEY